MCFVLHSMCVCVCLFTCHLLMSLLVSDSLSSRQPGNPSAEDRCRRHSPGKRSFPGQREQPGGASVSHLDLKERSKPRTKELVTFVSDFFCKRFQQNDCIINGSYHGHTVTGASRDFYKAQILPGSVREEQDLYEASLLCV